MRLNPRKTTFYQFRPAFLSKTFRLTATASCRVFVPCHARACPALIYNVCNRRGILRSIRNSHSSGPGPDLACIHRKAFYILLHILCCRLNISTQYTAPYRVRRHALP
jgi:hypothetical protein